MTVIRSSGAAESVFRIDDERIDIDRYDGSNQLGLVRMHDGELQMTLGDADKSRPRHHGHWKGSKQSDGPRHAYYTFQRRPTTEGMKMLSRYLGDELRVGKLIKVTPDDAKLGSLASSKTD